MCNFLENKTFFTDPETQKLYDLCVQISRFPNVKSSVGVLLGRKIGQRKEYLVVHRVDSDSFGNPAGHCTAGEDLLLALNREIFEETSISPHNFTITGIIDARLIPDYSVSALQLVFTGDYLGSDTYFVPCADPNIDYAFFLSKQHILNLTLEDSTNRGAIILSSSLLENLPSVEMISYLYEMLGEHNSYFPESPVIISD